MLAIFGGGQWTRAIPPWIGCVLLASGAGSIAQFWRDNLWRRDDVAWMLAIYRVPANEFANGGFHLYNFGWLIRTLRDLGRIFFSEKSNSCY